jgi:hypothetical protein
LRPVQAFAELLVPAVTTNATTSDVPPTLALICTFPADEPSVTFVFACPVASVVAEPGDSCRRAAGDAERHRRAATGLPELLTTLTTSGEGSACPTS